jgi:hypothetical protein
MKHDKVSSVWFVAMLATGCSKSHPAASPDAGKPKQPDAMVTATRSCANGFHQVAPPANALVNELASDGTLLYMSTSSTITSAIALQTVPIAGGAPTVVNTALDDEFHLASFGNAVFYGAHIGSTASYEVHEVSGGFDSTLGSVPSTTPIVLQANSTDVYVLGIDATAGLTLWRVSRDGVTGTPPVVASTGNDGQPSFFALGATQAAYVGASGIELVAIPGPSTPTLIPNVDGALAFVGDTGFRATDTTLTSTTAEVDVDQFTPSAARVSTTTLVQAQPTAFFSDAGNLFVASQPTADPAHGATPPSLSGFAADGSSAFELCNFDPHFPGAPIAHDARNIYGVSGITAGSMINVVPTN